MLLQILEHPSTFSNVLSSWIQYSGDNASTVWRSLCLPFIFLLLYNVWVYGRGKRNVLSSEAFFLFTTAIAFIFLRYPSYAAGEINPDEGEWIAGAATLFYDPRFWISVDGTTSGPLNIYPLCLLPALNVPLSFATARIFYVSVLLIPSVFLTFSAVRNFFDSLIARVAILPTVFLLTLTSHFDLSFYSSEYVSVFLLSIVIYAYSLFNRKRNFFLLAVAGITLGLLPYSKLQSLPIGGILGGFFIADILMDHKQCYLNRLRATLIICFSALVPTAIALAYLLCYNAFYDFWQSYILNNVVYGSQVSLTQTVTALPSIVVKYTKTAIPYYVITFLAPAICIFLLLTERKLKLTPNRKLFWYFHLIFIAAYYSIGKGWRFPHYELFIFFPLSLLNGYYYAWTKVNERPKLLSLFLYINLLLSLCLLLPDNALISKVLTDSKVPGKNPASERIFKYAQNKDKLVVWGFQDVLGSNGVYYLETGLIQGTRESHTQRPEGYFGTDDQLRYYRERFLKDIEESKPVAIIDLSQKDTVENFYPQLKQYISHNYFLDTIFYRKQSGINASGRYLLPTKWISTKVYICKSRTLNQ